MMQTIRLIRVNLTKTVSSYGFFAAVLLTVILLFTSSLYYDYTTNRDCSILQVLMQFSRAELLQDAQFCSYNVLRECVSGWLKMFIPMIASFSFVAQQYAERTTGAVRFSGIRLSKWGYQTGTFLSAMMTGKLVLLTGFAVFTVCTMFIFPSITAYDASLRESFECLSAQKYISDHQYSVFPEIYASANDQSASGKRIRRLGTR